MAKATARWINQLSEDDLLQLLPREAARRAHRPELAARIVLKDWENREQDIRLAPRKKAKKKAKKKAAARSTKKRSKRRTIKPTLWKRFVAEFRALLCTEDQRYATSRDKLSQYGRNGTLFVVAYAASAISPHVGIAATQLVPLTALALLTVARMGKEAVCKGWPEESE